MTATSLPARIAYALLTFPMAAFAAYHLTYQLLNKTTAHSPNCGMCGLVVFMGALAAAATSATTASLAALTLPWKRPVKVAGKRGRVIGSSAFILIAFIVLVKLNFIPLFAGALSICLAFAVYFTYVRHGIIDHSTA